MGARNIPHKMIAVGSTLKYTAFDEESYSRGYGIHYETRTSKVYQIRYKMEPYGDISFHSIKTKLTEDPKVGDFIEYEVLDEEAYSRGYGCHMERKKGKISEIVYRMDNGDLVRTKDILS